MVLSRRKFVRLGGLYAVAAGLSLGLGSRALGQDRRGSQIQTNAGFAIPYEAQRDALFHMTLMTFTQYLNSTFVIDPGYTFPINTTLIEVKDLRPAAAKKRNIPGQDCFLLTFQADSDKAPKQGTYQVRHGALGTFDLFVVPSKDSNGKVYFEAVINRLVG